MEGNRWGLNNENVSKKARRQNSDRGNVVLYMAALCFGLLSMVQAVLNVSLRLYFHTCAEGNISHQEGTGQLRTCYEPTTTDHREMLQSFIRNLTEDRDELQRRVKVLEYAVSVHGWRQFQSHYYLVSSKRRSWNESRHNCKERDADLVSINSKDEQLFVVNLGRMTRSIVWLGATDQDKEGVWRWVDDTPVTNGYWMKGQPEGDSQGEHDCAALLSSKYDALKTWDDANCNFKLHWICEKSAHQ